MGSPATASAAGSPTVTAGVPDGHRCRGAGPTNRRQSGPARHQRRQRHDHRRKGPRLHLGQHSSLYERNRYLAEGTTFEAVTGLSQPEYAPYGGSVPLIATAGVCEGLVIVSGLSQEDDHDLAHRHQVRATTMNSEHTQVGRTCALGAGDIPEVLSWPDNPGGCSIGRYSVGLQRLDPAWPRHPAGRQDME